MNLSQIIFNDYVASEWRSVRSIQNAECSRTWGTLSELWSGTRGGGGVRCRVEQALSLFWTSVLCVSPGQSLVAVLQWSDACVQGLMTFHFSETLWLPTGGWKPNWRARVAWRRTERKDRMVPCKLCREDSRKWGSHSSQTSDWSDICPCPQTGSAWDPRSFASGLLWALYNPQQLGRLQFHVRVHMLSLTGLKSKLSHHFLLPVCRVLSCSSLKGHGMCSFLWLAYWQVGVPDLQARFNNNIAKQQFTRVQKKAIYALSHHSSVSFILEEEMEKYNFLIISADICVSQQNIQLFPAGWEMTLFC